jgi:hypothetical protein
MQQGPLPKPMPGMQVTCSQRWDDLEQRGSVRHCSACDKPVTDFTDWDRDELRAWTAQHPGACGLFRLDQVQPDAWPLPPVGSEWLRGAMAVLTALALAGASAQQAPTPPVTTEQVAVNPASRAALRGEVVLIKAPEPAEAVACSAPERRPKYYLSARFPFIHRRRRVMGRVMGCPSF